MNEQSQVTERLKPPPQEREENLTKLRFACNFCKKHIVNIFQS